MAPASPSAKRCLNPHELLLSVSLFEHKNTQGARSFRGDLWSRSSPVMHLRQLTHGLHALRNEYIAARLAVALQTA